MVPSLSSIYIYMVGFLGSLVLQAKEGLWGSKNVPQDEVEQNETSQKDYELRGFFIELWLNGNQVFSHVIRFRFVRDELEQKKTSQKDTNWEAIIILIQNQTWVGRGNKIVIFYFSVKLPACCCNFSIIL